MRAMHRLAEPNFLQAELGLMMVPTTRPPSFVPRLWMRTINSMLTLRVMHRVAEHKMLPAELGLKMVPTTRPPSFVPLLWMRYIKCMLT